MEIRGYESQDEAAVLGLWKEAGLLRPWNDPRQDIARKLQFQPEGFLVGVLGSQLVATVMAGYDGHRGWINYLAVHPGHRHAGFGRAMMLAAEQVLRGVGCQKMNLQVRRDNPAALAFYRKMAFQEDEVISLGRRLASEGQ